MCQDSVTGVSWPWYLQPTVPWAAGAGPWASHSVWKQPLFAAACPPIFCFLCVLGVEEGWKGRSTQTWTKGLPLRIPSQFGDKSLVSTPCYWPRSLGCSSSLWTAWAEGFALLSLSRAFWNKARLLRLVAPILGGGSASFLVGRRWVGRGMGQARQTLSLFP